MRLDLIMCQFFYQVACCQVPVSSAMQPSECYAAKLPVAKLPVAKCLCHPCRLELVDVQETQDFGALHRISLLKLPTHILGLVRMMLLHKTLQHFPTPPLLLQQTCFWLWVLCHYIYQNKYNSKPACLFFFSTSSFSNPSLTSPDESLYLQMCHGCLPVVLWD